MIKPLSFTTVLLYILQPCYCLETLPVLVVDTGGVSVMGANVGNPFHKITNKVFSEMIKAIVSKASLTLIFVDSDLSVEDISKRDAHGSPFKAFLQEMSNEKKLLYLPSVVDPYNTLTSLLPANHENLLDYTTAKQRAKEFKPFSHVYIKFEPAQPTVERLRIHDLAMRSILRSARTNNNGSLVAFYTGMNNPLVIEQKRYPKAKSAIEKSIMVASKRVLFHLSLEFELAAVRGLKTVEHSPVVKQETEHKSPVVDGDDKLSTTLSFTPFDLQFNFLLRKKDWILDNITLIEVGENVGHIKIGIGAPWRSSYHCAETMKIINTRDQSAVILKRYQWQPTREKCELSKNGCEDKSALRSRFNLPIGTLKDFKKHKELHKSKMYADGEDLDENDTWGFNKKVTTKNYDYEALYEAEGDQKAHDGTEKGSIGDHKHTSNKHKNKPANTYIYNDDGEHKANEEAVIDIFDQKDNKENIKDDPVSHKKQYIDKNLDAVLNSHGNHIKYSYINSNKHKDNFGSHGHQKVNTVVGKNPFAQSKLNHNKNSKDIDGSDYLDDSDEDKANAYIKHKKPGLEFQGKALDKNINDPSGLQTGASSSKGLQQSEESSEKPSQLGTPSQGGTPLQGGTPSQGGIPSQGGTPLQGGTPAVNTIQSGQQATGSVSTQDLKFGSSVNCGPYFNHEILSCLFVTFIILIMLFYGLEVMLNLQANVHFDNFGEKTLTIAEEK